MIKSKGPRTTDPKVCEPVLRRRWTGGQVNTTQADVDELTTSLVAALRAQVDSQVLTDLDEKVVLVGTLKSRNAHLEHVSAGQRTEISRLVTKNTQLRRRLDTRVNQERQSPLTNLSTAELITELSSRVTELQALATIGALLPTTNPPTR